MSPRAIMRRQSLTVKNIKFQFEDFIQGTEPPKTNATDNSLDERVSDVSRRFWGI